MLRRNVLILHTGALGDFVLAWPLILALGRIHAQSRIIVVTHASKGALAEAALRVESADIEQGWHGLFGGGAPLAERPGKMVEGAHAIYNFITPDDSALKALAPEAQIVTLQSTPPADYAKQASQYLLDQLTKMPPVKSAVEQMLKSVNLRGIGTGRSHDGDVVVHPGSGSREKCWPIERFVKVIERLRRNRKEVRVLLGEVELERFAAADIKSLETAATTVRRPATYLELFNELRTASLLVGNDSGPGHLAGIMGVPTIALFGPTDPAVWRPMGPRVKTLHNPAIEKIAVNDVLAAAKELAGA
ncbi:MAG: hypothetical protein QOF78_4443 [Phycisphaerales bacterium]|nr:hypothetical protein [Phycisphaerales bacterium]